MSTIEDCLSPISTKIRDNTSIRPVTAPAAAATAGNSSTAAVSADKGSNVQVVVRCRPPTESEKRSGDIVLGIVGNTEVQVNAKKDNKLTKKTFTFDQSYGQLSTQEEVYNNSVKPLVEEVLAGFNCTVFAYGMTGTGKTYTMEGELSNTSNGSKHAGVIPRSIHTIFDTLESQKLEYSVKVSFLELYNEELSDLLSEQGDNDSNNPGEQKELRIFEDSTGKRGMLVNNLEEVIVTSAADVFQLLHKSWLKRRTAETLLNKNSSRSHCVFTITVHTKESNEDGEDIIKTGKLYLVDLAGSECVGKSGALNQRAKEAGKINQSLLTLGRVINALVDKAGYIPYRDSKLTRLLQESLGGRAKTVIIATVSPSITALDETLNTLDYAHRAKNIRNRPQVNQKMTKRAYMKELLDEIHSLKRENEVLRLKNGIYLPPEKYDSMLAESKGKGLLVDEYSFTLKAKETELLQLNTLLTDTQSKLTNTIAEKAAVTEKLTETITVLDSTNTQLKSTEIELLTKRTELGSNKLLLTTVKQVLNESNHIITERSLTEAKLHTEAATVVNLAESVVSDKNKLHDKIDRKSAVETHNQQANSILESKFNMNINQLQSNFNSFIMNTNNTINQSLQSNIIEITKQNQLTQNELLEQTNTVNQVLLDSESLLIDNHNNYINQSKQSINQSNNDSIQYHNQLQSKLIDTASINTKALNTVSSTVSKSAESSNNYNTSTTEILNNNLSTVQKFTNQSTTVMESINTAVINNSERQVSTLQSHSVFINDFLTKQNELSAKLTANLLTSVSTLIENYQRAHSESLTTAINELTAKFTQNINIVQSDSTIVQKSAKEYINNTATVFNTNLIANHQQQLKQLDSAQSVINATNNAIITAVNEVSADINNRITAINTADKAQINQLQSTASTAITNLEQYNSAHLTAVESIKSVQSEFISSHTKSIDNAANTTKQSLNQVSTVLSSLNQSVTAHSIQHTADINSTIIPVQNYLSVDYKFDIATGATPQKQLITVPRTFTTTAQHNLLINSYRQQHLNEIESINSTVNNDADVVLAQSNGATINYIPPTITITPIPNTGMNIVTSGSETTVSAPTVQIPVVESPVAVIKSPISPVAAVESVAVTESSPLSAPATTTATVVPVESISTNTVTTRRSNRSRTASVTSIPSLESPSIDDSENTKPAQNSNIPQPKVSKSTVTKARTGTGILPPKSYQSTTNESV